MHGTHCHQGNRHTLKQASKLDECSSHVDFLLSQNRNDDDLEKPRTTVAEPVNEDLDEAIFVTSKGKPWHVDNDKNQSLVDSVLDTTRVS